MIKGVNKKIIEINVTDNPYFDKVVLFLSEQGVNKNLKQSMDGEMYSYVNQLNKEYTLNDEKNLRKSSAAAVKKSGTSALFYGVICLTAVLAGVLCGYLLTFLQ